MKDTYICQSHYRASLVIYFLEIKLFEHSLTEYGSQSHANAPCLCRFWIDLSLAVHYVCVISGILHMPYFKPLIMFVKCCCVDLAHSIYVELVRWRYCLLGMWLELIKWHRRQHLFWKASIVSKNFEFSNLQLTNSIKYFYVTKNFHGI